MLPPVLRPLPAVLGLCVVLVLSPAGRAADPEHQLDPADRIEARVEEAAGRATLTFRGRPLAVYAFAATQHKPYLRDLHTLRGENVLRDAPADHLHHHGLMYAIRVNGVNFWEEREPAGRQVGRRLPRVTTGRGPDGVPRAVVRHALSWRDEHGRELLTEDREIVVSVNPGVEEVAVDWTGEFRVPRGATAQLTGSNYNGLGLRLPESWDGTAVFRNPGGEAYREPQSGEVKAAPWTAVEGRMAGREVMVALVAAPGNAGTSGFFTMRQPFAYLSATQGLDRAPLEYAGRGTFRVRYLLLAYPAAQPDGFLGPRLERWRTAATARNGRD